MNIKNTKMLTSVVALALSVVASVGTSSAQTSGRGTTNKFRPQQTLIRWLLLRILTRCPWIPSQGWDEPGCSYVGKPFPCFLHPKTLTHLDDWVVSLARLPSYTIACARHRDGMRLAVIASRT